MDYREAFAISATGMNFEKQRLDAAAANLANMHATTGPDGARYRPLRVVAATPSTSFAAAFGQQSPGVAALGVHGVRLELVDSPPRMVHDPGHPHADANGMVAFPGVDHVSEMVTLNSALRSYQANVVAMNAAKAMALKALEIGSGK
ncbi:flagellar basal body rod protein FlgC [Aquabacterium humicola]|uniref:flagellar basal body rod protein FlgC n=1 Tax=Aquabacterium humicola TaxID=3237377 RepID=UPI002542BA70|nr:flagellar basal body rod protein FlgC [Rubrivivax pictus]